MLGQTPAVSTARHRMGELEFVLFLGLLSAVSALAIDMVLPAFSQMRPAFGLDPDSTRLSLVVTLFLMGTGFGNLLYGPIADALGRKRALVGSMVLYGIASLSSALAPTLGVLYLSRFVWGIAAAGHRTLTQAIVRDRFAGTAMARVMTLVQAAFFISPILAPALGKGVLVISSWRWVLASGTFIALAVSVWSLRLGETLDPANRRSLKFRRVVAGFRSVLGTRVTLGYALAITFGFGAFMSYLGSTELIFSELYDKSQWFVAYFTAAGVIAAAVALTTNRVLRVVEARQVALGAGAAFAAASAVLFIATVAADGLPSFWLWLALFSLANAIHVAVLPTVLSLALEPMARMAGTAAAVLGFMSSAGGGLLASFTDRAIDDTVMPIGIAYVVYSSLALGCQLWARSSRPF